MATTSTIFKARVAEWRLHFGLHFAVQVGYASTAHPMLRAPARLRSMTAPVASAPTPHIDPVTLADASSSLPSAPLSPVCSAAIPTVEEDPSSVGTSHSPPPPAPECPPALAAACANHCASPPLAPSPPPGSSPGPPPHGRTPSTDAAPAAAVVITAPHHNDEHCVVHVAANADLLVGV